MRRLSCSSSCSRRLVTTSRRKWRKYQSICLRSRRSGRPTSAFSVGTRHVMLTANVVCSDVFLNRYAITRLSSAPRLQLQLDPHIVGRHVPDVDEVRHLAAEHDVADLLDELRLVDRVGNARDVELLARSRRRSGFPGGAQADRARAGLVDLLQLVRRVEDVAAGRKVGALHPAAQLQRREIGIVEQLDQRGADLAEVVRRDVGGHAHRDAGGAVDQQVGNARRQHDRLGLGAVVVGTERRPSPARSPAALRRRPARGGTRCSASPRRRRRRAIRSCRSRRPADSAARTTAPCARAFRRWRCRRAGGSCPSRRRPPSRTCGAWRRRSGSAATS